MRSIAELVAWIESDAGLAQLLTEARRRLLDDPGHDAAHCLRVGWWALRLTDGLIDPRCVVSAALLHDIVNVPKDSPERAQASRRSAEVARALLPTCGFAPREVELVAEAIVTHSFSLGELPVTLLGEALQDADRLEALGALGILRTAACGAQMGASFFHADDPFAERRALDDRAFSIDHFFKKLLTLSRTMCSLDGQREALRRTARMVEFLRALGDEIGRAPPEARLVEALGDHLAPYPLDEIYRDAPKDYDRLVSFEDCDGELMREIERAAHLSGARVLEVGAGTGRITKGLIERGASVSGFDREAAMLSVARERLAALPQERWSLSRADARFLPVAKASFDVAIAGWVLGHFRHRAPSRWRPLVARAVQEMERALRGGGTLIVIESLGALSPAPEPNAGREAYHAFLGELGFQPAQIRTDFLFPDLQTAAALVGMFFGEPLGERVRRSGSARVPECTAVFVRRLPS